MGYKKILDGHIPFPRHFDVKAKHLVKNLLLHDPVNRFSQIDCMCHVWFDFVEWKLLLDQDSRLRTPWKPRIDSATDVRQDDFESAPPIGRKDNKFFVGYF